MNADKLELMIKMIKNKRPPSFDINGNRDFEGYGVISVTLAVKGQALYFNISRTIKGIFELVLFCKENGFISELGDLSYHKRNYTLINTDVRRVKSVDEIPFYDYLNLIAKELITTPALTKKIDISNCEEKCTYKEKHEYGFDEFTEIDRSF